jgi:alanine racemase
VPDSQISSPPFSRPIWAEIDLAALRHNARTLADHVAPATLLGVIKAGAYGHGAAEVAAALQPESSVAGFGVASIDEGLSMRRAGVTKPILLLSAILPEEAPTAVEAGLMPTVWTEELAARLQAEGEKRSSNVAVHFKVDTGMGRLGVWHCEAAERWRQLQRFGRLEFQGIYTHLACADETEDHLSPQQLSRFESVLREIQPPAAVIRHAANSAGILRYPGAHLDMVRAGLALYGIHPCPHVAPQLDLRPVMTWKARVTSVKAVPEGASVSYGALWRASRTSRIATIPVGYADGYFRSLSNRGEVWLNGSRYPVVGRVTMDQILVDVTNAEIPVQPGDTVTLFGQNLPVQEVAARAGTIPWELLCAVSQRVTRVYTGTT